MNYLDRINTFTENNLPDLDEVVLAALQLFSENTVAAVNVSGYKRPLVVGSGNAAITGRVMFAGTDAVFADESTYEHKLAATDDIDAVIVISASGSKHAVGIAEAGKQQGLPVMLFTNNADAPAKSVVGEECTHVFPKNREPYTYNTSTYLGMMLSVTNEDASSIMTFIENEVAPIVPDTLASHGAFYLMVPEQFDTIREMFVTKFDELFGPQLMGRVFTKEQTKHAKTVIPHDSELFISFGAVNDEFGDPANRLTIPLPADASFGAMMMVGYYVIGCIQKQKPPLYKDRIAEYIAETSAIFGTNLSVIVE